jgi:alkylation response protein AidB-like acyl-CoA dehydrogenase
MFFGFTEEEKMIQRSVRDMLRKHCTTEHVRKFMEQPRVSREMQGLIAQQGLLGILNPNVIEEGVGKGVLYAVLIAQEAGRALLPFPLLENMVGLYALKTCKRHGELIHTVESGQKLLSIAWGKADARAYREGDQYVLSGILKEIPFAEDVDAIIASVPVAGMGNTLQDEETIVIIDTRDPAVTVRNRSSMDQTYPLYEISLSRYNLTTNAVVQGLGMGVGHKLMEKMKQLGALLISAEMVGGAERALYETVEYTKQRKQFGTEIARFQALKHMAADMLLLVESAKAAVEYAGWAVDNDSEDADLSVSIAKSYASEAAIQVTGDAIQMHGGIGFTWENDMHLFFKRARRSASVLGDVYAHREKIARYTLDPIKAEVLA